MRFLRYLEIVALATWIGGLAALGSVVAPATFEVLEAADAATGRQLAGRVFGAVLEQFSYVGLGLGAAVLVSLGVRAVLGPRPRRFAIRMWTLALMMAATLILAYYITPRIDAIRESTAGVIASLPDHDPRRSEFGRLHGLSTGLMVLTILAGLALLWTETRDEH
jgi:hypothetical protein